MVYDIEKYTLRSRKLGAEIIGGALGLASTGLGLIGSASEIDTNLSENEKNRKFNAEEAEKQRAWSHDEWDYQFGKQTGEWYNQQDYSNEQAFDYWMKQQEYNSPSAQISRLQRTGLNPAHVVGDTTFGSTGLSAAPTAVPNPSVPSGHAASVGLSNPVSVGAKAQAFASMAKGISDVLNGVYGAKRSAAETEKTEKTLDPIIKGLLLDNTNKQLINVWQNLDNLEKQEGMPDRLANLSKQGKLLISQAMAATSSSDLMNVQKELESLRKSLVSTETNIKGKELLIVTAEAENIQTAIDLKNELLRQQSKTEKSKQSANYAVAFNQRAQGKTWNELRPLQHDLLDIQNKISEEIRQGKHFDNIIKGGALPEACAAFVASCEREGIINAVERKRLDRAIKENNFYEVNQFIDWVSTGFDAYRNAGIGTSAFRGFESGSKPSFDGDAGKGFVMDKESGLLFKAPWSK